MNSKLCFSGLLAVGSLAYFLFKTQAYNKQRIPDLSIEQLIRQAYLRVSTRQNVKVVYDLINLSEVEAKQTQSQLLKSFEGVLLEPYMHTLKSGGKKMRLIMTVIISELFTGRQQHIPKDVLMIGGLIEFLHCASLIIDDIEDQSKSRRGQKCSYLMFGLSKSVNSANLMYFLPFLRLIEKIDSPGKRARLFQIFIDEMTVSHMGQAQDVQTHKLSDPKYLPTYVEYETLTVAKTGGLLRMMVRMLCVVFQRSAKETDKLIEVMNYTGLAFQVTDDLLNLTENMGKGQLAEDLREKKFTPIIHLMRNNPQFIQLFLLNNKTQKNIQQMLAMIKNSDIVQQTKQLASNYQQTAEKLMLELRTPYSKTNFMKLMKFIVTRNK